MGLFNSIWIYFRKRNFPMVGIVDAVCPYCNTELKKSLGVRKNAHNVAILYMFAQVQKQMKRYSSQIRKETLLRNSGVLLMAHMLNSSRIRKK